MKKFIDTVAMIVAMLGPLVMGGIMGFSGYGWFYFLTVFTFYLCFGLFEFLSVKFRKKTISQDISRLPAPLFWGVIGTWTFMHVILTLHWYLGRS